MPMPLKKLRPIEERDPYAALVLEAFDRLEQGLPPLSEELPAARHHGDVIDVDHKVFMVDFVNRKRL